MRTSLFALRNEFRNKLGRLSSAIYLTSVLIFIVFLFPTLSQAVPAPPNEECVDAENIFDGTTFYDSTGASSSPPAFICAGGGSDIWYIYTPTCTGTVQIDTNGSGYDTALEAIAGTNCNDLTNVIQCNDDGGTGFDSRLEFTVTQGVSFLVRVGGFNDASGSGQVNIECVPFPPNDECTDSIEVFNGSNPFDNIAATPQNSPTDPPMCVTASKDVWFDYRATCTGDVIFSTCNTATFDTVLEIFDGDNCNNLSSLNCNDDNCPGFRSEFTQSLVEGDRYLIRVASFGSGFSGGGDLEIVPQQGCKESPCFFKKNALNGITVRNGSPNKKVRVVWGFKKGKGSLSGTKCDGLSLGIKPNQSLATIKMNNQGNKNNGTIYIPSTSAKKGFIQMVDLKTCEAGEVRKVILVADSPPPGGCVYTFDNPPINGADALLFPLEDGPLPEKSPEEKIPLPDDPVKQ